MDISQEMLIDIGLNMAGFLVAGALMLVIYSMFNRRRYRSAETGQGASLPAVSKNKRTPDSAPVHTRMEFVKFGESNTRQNDKDLEVKSAGWSKRAEVIRKAREMMAAGASAQEVKAALPVSAAELAMLSYKGK